MDFKPFSLFQSLFHGKDNFTKTPILNVSQVLNGKSPLWVTTNGQESLLFDTTPELYSVIMTKAEMYSNGIFKHLNAKGEEIIDSPYVNFLNNPNPLQSRSEWMKEEMIHTCVFGNSFTFGLKGDDNQEIPFAFYNLPPDLIKIIPTGFIYTRTQISEIIDKYILQMNGIEETYESKDVIFSRIQNSNNKIVGKSPFVALQMPISNIRGAYGFRNILINEHGAIGLLSNQTKGEDGGIPLLDEERKKLENQLNKDYGINDGQSKVMMTSAALSWTPMIFPTKDLMLFEEISEDFKKVIDAYGMNEHLFTKSDKGKGTTYENLREGKKMVYQDAIIPYSNNRSEKYTKYFKLDLIKEKIIIDYSHIEALQSNENEKASTNKLKSEAYTKLKETGDFSTDELKTITGL